MIGVHDAEYNGQDLCVQTVEMSVKFRTTVPNRSDEILDSPSQQSGTRACGNCSIRGSTDAIVDAQIHQLTATAISFGELGMAFSSECWLSEHRDYQEPTSVRKLATRTRREYANAPSSNRIIWV